MGGLKLIDDIGISKKENTSKEEGILGMLTNATLQTEGLIKGQTPLRITNEAMRRWNTIQGIPIDKDAKIPSDRRNFFFVKPDKVSEVIRRQWENYFKNPRKYGLSEDSTVEDVIKKFDQQNPQNKLNLLQKWGVDIKKKIKDFDISSLFIPNAYGQEVSLRLVDDLGIFRHQESPITLKDDLGIFGRPKLFREVDTPAGKQIVFDPFVKVGEKIKKGVSAYLKNGENAVKLVFLRPDVAFGKYTPSTVEEAKRILEETDKSWAELWRESPLGRKVVPSLKDIGEHPAKSFIPWLILEYIPSELVSMGTKPSSWVIWKGLDNVMPIVGKAVLAKVAQRSPKLFQFLTKEIKISPKVMNRLKGELAGARYRIMKVFGKQGETALRPLTDVELKEAVKNGDISLAQALRQSPTLLAERQRLEIEAGKKITGELSTLPRRQPEMFQVSKGTPKAVSKGKPPDKGIPLRDQLIEKYGDVETPFGKISKLSDEDLGRVAGDPERYIGRGVQEAVTKKITPVSRRKRSDIKTLVGLVKEIGGIDPQKAKVAGYPMQTFKEFGLMGVLKKGGFSPDEIAQELISIGELPQVETENPADTLISTLKDKPKRMGYIEKEVDKAIERMEKEVEDGNKLAEVIRKGEATPEEIHKFISSKIYSEPPERIDKFFRTEEVSDKDFDEVDRIKSEIEGKGGVVFDDLDDEGHLVLRYILPEDILPTSVSKEKTVDIQKQKAIEEQKALTGEQPYEMTREEYWEKTKNIRISAIIPQQKEKLIAKIKRIKEDLEDAIRLKKRNTIKRNERLLAKAETDLKGLLRGKIIDKDSAILRKHIESNESHKKLIRQALSEGKPVPPEVLKDYPDLAKEYKGKIEFHTGVPLVPEVKLPQVTVLDKLIKKIDVEAPFKSIGVPKTGIALKNYFSKVETEQEKGLQVIKELNKYKLSPEEYQELTFIAYRPTKFVKLNEEQRRKLSPAYQRVREYFKISKKELQEAEIISEGFPQSLVKRLKDENVHLRKVLERNISAERRAKIKAEVDANLKTIKFIEKGRIQYVPLPLRLWFKDILDRNPTKVKKLISQYFRKRETVDLEGLANYLLEEGIIKPRDLDIRRIIGSYAHQKGLKLSMANIINTAKQEGLLKPFDESPADWVQLPSRVAPGLKGYKGHPAFIEYLEDNFLRFRGLPPEISRPLAYVKMMQFYNPLFLPAYDLYQAYWLGSFRNVRTPIYLAKGFRSLVRKDDVYWQAMENGAISQPFVAPFDKFMERVDREIRNDTTLKKIYDWLDVKYGVKVIDNIYRLSSNIAWGGDKGIRLSSMHYLLDKGFTPEEAAQTVALFHGDYASLPPSTKALLNKLFFTPTFKIVMTKAQLRMAKALGEKIFLGKTSKRDDILAIGFLALISMIVARRLLFKHWGFKEEDFGVRYVKSVSTPEGNKELVIYVPTPDNILLRYWSKLKRVPSTEDMLEKGLKLSPFNLHPLWDWALRVILTNKDYGGEPIRNPFDSLDKQSKDVVVFTIRRLVRITEIIEKSPTAEKKQKAVRLLGEDLGNVGRILSLFVFPYVRGTKEKRGQYKLFKAIQDFRRMAKLRPAKSSEEYNEQLGNLREKLRKIREEIEEE